MTIIIQKYATEYDLFKSVTALHVSGGISTHHQELISLYLQYLALMRPVLLAVVNVAGRELQIQCNELLMMGEIPPETCWAVDRFK